MNKDRIKIDNNKDKDRCTHKNINKLRYTKYNQIKLVYN